MNYVRPDVYKAITENDIGEVVFQDPLTDDTRKAKRNLVAGSFTALLIAALNLQVSGFLGLQTAVHTTLESSITKGLACLIVGYFLSAFALAAYVDYSAWKFTRERALTKPYLDLVSMLEAHFHITGEQVKNAMHGLDGTVIETDMRSQVQFSSQISSATGQLKAIQEGMNSLHAEVAPLLAKWATVITRSERLSWRLRARFISLWLLDLLLPLLLGGLAIWKTYDGLSSVLVKLVT
ncbi:hypothetical protein [Burkholderia sp. BCC1644]|uniref:hypothetical protein n=1 Tax=Burkholderia sp. BCC1644 TaxID=2676293 RepID=UPI001590894D|nr:hypothetical protein [Burkholderia sp. BCC1644]